MPGLRSLHKARCLSLSGGSVLASRLSHSCRPQRHCHLWPLWELEAKTPTGDGASLTWRPLSQPKDHSPEPAWHPGTSPCHPRPFPRHPHIQDGRRWDLSRPISSQTVQGLYPLLPWQPAFFSGSLYCTRGSADDRESGIQGGMRVAQQELGPKDGRQGGGNPGQTRVFVR